nr:hypothetical protein [Microvirga aerophila]
MAGLAYDAALDPAPQLAQELICNAGLEAQARRQLNQQWTELVPKATHLRHEPVQQVASVLQPSLMGDGLRHLYGKAEVVRHRDRPALLGGHSVQAIER